MRFLSLCIVIVIFLAPSTSAAIDWTKGALNVYLSSEAYHQDVRGNEENSVLDEGWFYPEIKTYNYDYSFYINQGSFLNIYAAQFESVSDYP